MPLFLPGTPEQVNKVPSDTMSMQGHPDSTWTGGVLLTYPVRALLSPLPPPVSPVAKRLPRWTLLWPPDALTFSMRSYHNSARESVTRAGCLDMWGQM